MILMYALDYTIAAAAVKGRTSFPGELAAILWGNAGIQVF